MFKAFLLTNDLFRLFCMRGENAVTVKFLNHRAERRRTLLAVGRADGVRKSMTAWKNTLSVALF
jgi:hypothetical protein